MTRSAARFVAFAALVAHGVLGVSAQGDCDQRIVAACVVGTFAGCAVVAAAVAVFLLLRRRSRRRRRLGVVDRLAKSFNNNTNGAFASSDSIAFTYGHEHADEALQTDKGQIKWIQSKQCHGKQHDKHDGGARAVAALDDACQPLQKWVTADLLSKDVGGLGLDVSSSYTGGVFVKNLQDLSPAKQCGLVDIGDRIVSITISFENIVHEDAVVILSRASPYRVRLQLLKQQCSDQQQRALSPALGSSPSVPRQLQSCQSAANGKAGSSGMLLHPAFARSQSLSNGAAVTGQLFHESLLSYENANRSRLDSEADLDNADAGSVASDCPSVSLPRAKVPRTRMRRASGASVTALPGTVRLDIAEAGRVAAMVHGSPAERGSSTSSGGSDSVVSNDEAYGNRALPRGQCKLDEPPGSSMLEHALGHLPCSSGIGGGGAGDAAAEPAAVDPSKPAPEAPLTEALPLPSLVPPAQCAPVQPESCDDDAAVAAAEAVAVGATASSHEQGSAAAGLQHADHSQTFTGAAAATSSSSAAIVKVGRHSVEEELEDGMTEGTLPTRESVASDGPHMQRPQAAGNAAADSRSRDTDSASSSPVPGSTRGSGAAKHETTTSGTTDKPTLRPRHLPIAIMELMQRKEAASVVLDKLEAFATFARNNNPGSNESDKPSQPKVQVANGSITIGHIQTPEDESSMLTAVLNAAKMTDEVNGSTDEGSVLASGQQQPRSAHSDDEGSSSSSSSSSSSVSGPDEQAEIDLEKSLTSAAEIKALAAKFGTLGRPHRVAAEAVVPSSALPPTVVPVVQPPLDPRSIEEARANYFSDMLRAAKS